MKAESLTLVYLDDYFVAVNKPSGLLVHRSEIDKNETLFLLQLLRDRLGQSVYPVHRLDKPTSGVILFALDKMIAKDLSVQFEQHSVVKHYLAIVRGYCDSSGHIDHPLKEKAVFRSQNPQQLSTQSAITDYHKLAQVELPFAVDRYPSGRYSLLRLAPKTGRRHQLRRHMKHIAHPIIGDTSYGKTTHNQLFREQLNCQRLLLHAESLTLIHPVNKKQMMLEAPLTDDFDHVLKQLSCYESFCRYV